MGGTTWRLLLQPTRPMRPGMLCEPCVDGGWRTPTRSRSRSRGACSAQRLRSLRAKRRGASCRPGRKRPSAGLWRWGALPRSAISFNVRQGVLTGLNSVFLLKETQVAELPLDEHGWFRRAIVNESIRNGMVRSRHRVFYPYNRKGLAINSESVLAKVLPAYFERYLLPARSRLEGRSDVRRAKQPCWWGLSQRRTWALDGRPRLVSKYFGGPGGFAADLDAHYIVVQGYAVASEVVHEVIRSASAGRCPRGVHGHHELDPVRPPA